MLSSDVLTLLLIIKSRNKIAAQQFLTKLISDTSTHIDDYPKTVLLKATTLASLTFDPLAKSWLENIY